MKFRKDKWERVKLGEIGKIQYGCSAKSSEKVIGYKTFRMNELINGVAKDNGSMKYTDILEKEFLKYKLFQGDILFNRTNSYELVGKTGIFLINTGDYMFASYLMRISVDRSLVIPHYLNSLMNSDLFQKQIKVYATKAVGQANVNAKSLSKLEFPLPPLEEQKQIATLFQSLENAIEQVENQEKNLKALQKKLSSSLISTNPIFGNLLTDKNCNLCTFEDITNCVEKHDKKPLENGITRFIGLEFIEAENFNLQGFGEIEKGTTFTKCFLKNDVLFGKRRAYLKKVSVADFDGICSGDILVFRAKKEKMLPELLPYYVSSDAFIQHAVNTSAGSLSPRTKWKDLKEFKISIPDLKTQKKIAEIFQQLQLTLNQLKQQKITLNNLKQKLLSEILG